MFGRMKRMSNFRKYELVLIGLMLVLAMAGHPAHAQAGSTLKDGITGFFNDAIQTAISIAPAVAMLGFLGLGVMYLGSSWPIIGDWKRDNPKAANQVTMGLLFLVGASTFASFAKGIVAP